MSEHAIYALGIGITWVVSLIWAYRANKTHAKHHRNILIIIDGEEV